MTADTTYPPAVRAGRREWSGLAVLALPTLLLSLDMSVLYLALPFLSADLQPTATQQLWIMDVYGFMIAGFLITMGTLGDRIGRRRLLMIGGTAFAVASVVAAYSSSAQMLIATRALLGIAGATLMPSTLALISTMFRDPHQRGVAIAVWMSCFMGGMTVGPLVGGVLMQHFWWGSAFLLGVPVMALLLVTAPLLLPEHRDQAAGRLDLTSVGLSLAAILPVIYGLKELAHTGWDLPALATVATGVAFGWAFARRQLRLADPHIDVRLFARRQFSTALGLNVGGGVVMAGTFLLLTQFLQLVVGLTPLRAGLSLVPLNIAMAAATMAAPQLARRHPPVRVMTTGFAIAAAGMTVAALSSGAVGLLVGFGLACVGVALPSALLINLIVGSVPPEKAGAASGISETSGEFGIALGVAVLGSAAGMVYRDQLSVPAGVPADAAAVAHESLAGAVAVAKQLPADVAATLLDPARAAFGAGLEVAAIVGAVLFAAMAVATARVFHAGEGSGTPIPETEATTREPALVDEPC